MNKTAVKNFAVWAREKLISDIKYKAQTIGITKNGIAEKLPQSTKDMQFFDIGTKNYAEVAGDDIAKRNALVDVIKSKERSFKTYQEAFDNVVEEVAYTWFNRLIAIRFMEVNDYLPSGVRVLSAANPAKKEPDIVTKPFETDLEFTSAEQSTILRYKDEISRTSCFACSLSSSVISSTKSCRSCLKRRTIIRSFCSIYPSSTKTASSII